MAKLKRVGVKINLPFIGSVEGTWEADELQQQAAWEMHVELVTRIAVVPLAPGEGLLREALTSFHSLFGITREILRRSGPTVAQTRGGEVSFGYLAVAVLNTVLRPLLTRWHPVMLEYDASRPDGTSATAHERAWPGAQELRVEIENTRTVLVEYADLLAEVAGVPSLVVPSRTPVPKLG